MTGRKMKTGCLNKYLYKPFSTVLTLFILWFYLAIILSAAVISLQKTSVSMVTGEKSQS